MSEELDIYLKNGTLQKGETGTWQVLSVDEDRGELLLTLVAHTKKPLPNQGWWVKVEVLGS